MDKYKDIKHLKMALNGRMLTILASVFLLFSAVTGTMQYGLGLFYTAIKASQGDAERLQVIQDTGVSVGYVYLAAVILLVVMALEMFAGVAGLMMANRLKKAPFLFRLALMLLAAVVVLQPVMLLIGIPMISKLPIPLLYLWSTRQLQKLSMLYPDEVYVAEPKGKKGASKPGNKGGRAADTQAAGKKSIMDRALITHLEEDTEDHQSGEDRKEVEDHQSGQDQKKIEDHQSGEDQKEAVDDQADDDDKEIEDNQNMEDNKDNEK